MLSCFSPVWLCAILWTVAHQAPLSMEFSRWGYWSGLPCAPPGDLSDPGIEPASLTSPALAGRFFTTHITWEACVPYNHCFFICIISEQTGHLLLSRLTHQSINLCWLCLPQSSFNPCFKDSSHSLLTFSPKHFFVHYSIFFFSPRLLSMDSGLSVLTFFFTSCSLLEHLSLWSYCWNWFYKGQGFPGNPVVRNLPANAGAERDEGLIPGSGRSPGGGCGNPLQYSCLKTPMDREACWPTVHGVAKSWTWLTTHTPLINNQPI